MAKSSTLDQAKGCPRTFWLAVRSHTNCANIIHIFIVILIVAVFVKGRCHQHVEIMFFFVLIAIIIFISLVLLSLSLLAQSHNLLPLVLDSYFLPSKKVHHYNTRLYSGHAYAILNVRTNYGLFNIKFAGAKVWNSLDAELKPLSIKAFKARVKEKFVSNY